MSKDFNKYIKEFEEVSRKLTEPDYVSNSEKLKKLSFRHNELEEIVDLIKQIEQKKKIIKNNEELIKLNNEEDSELLGMAKQENEEMEKRIGLLQNELDILTLPKDPHDDRDVILEIRSGAGGDEAGLFASELFRAYSRFAEKNDLKLSLINISKNEVGGIKELVAQIEGEGAYGQLKYESGVHRVQRIPETEKSGRIHTSTVTVAVLPKALEEDVELKTEDVKVDTFRSSGPGGQSVNTTDSAIRLTHVLTGIVVTCQDEKSQHKNKAKAFSVLRSKLLQIKREEEQKKIDSLRTSQIGTGDRSEKIRTYNFSQDRITDHRVKKSWHGIESVMAGEMEDIFNDLKNFEIEKKKEHAN